jgi:hypothetical protein
VVESPVKAPGLASAGLLLILGGDFE